MDSSFEAHMIQATCQWLHEKYGYTKSECQAYIKGYMDCQAFMDKQVNLDNISIANKELYRVEGVGGLEAQRSV